MLVTLLALVVQAQAAHQPGRLIERIPCPSDPSQTYTLYLPSRYSTTRTWPLLLVFDPGARGARAAELFRDAAERYGWIVAASETSRNGPWEPTRRAVTAMWPALMQSLAVDPNRVYTAGHSGGATVAWTLARQSGQVAGVIASGPPDTGDDGIKAQGFAWFGSAGRTDFNFASARDIDRRIARAGNPHRVEFFEGGHQWLPAPLVLRAMGWLEIVAMRQGRRPRDQHLIDEILTADLAGARELESSEHLTEAHRVYGTIVESYAGLADTGEAAARLKRIEADDRFKRARRDEQRTDDRERARMDTVGQIARRLFEPDPPLPGDLRGLEIESLHKAAQLTSYDGYAARRSLETIFAQVNDLARQLEEKREYGRAALVLELAAAVHPERQRVWLDLAAARAASGSKGLAITALQRAVDLGFTNIESLNADARFTALRSSREFEQFLLAFPKK